MENNKFKQITLDRHGPRLIPNHCHLPYPPYFSLLSTGTITVHIPNILIILIIFQVVSRAATMGGKGNAAALHAPSPQLMLYRCSLMPREFISVYQNQYRVPND
jgi:hypothetical protein